MKKDNIGEENNHPSNAFADILEETLRLGARRLLQEAVDFEVDDYIEMYKALRGLDNRRLVIRNGYLPERAIQTGLGAIKIRQPRIRDKRDGKSFTSRILPKYVRRSPSVEAVLPILYLKGISTGDFSEALEALLGVNAAGLSASTICRLKEGWKEEFKEWSSRDLSMKHYVYVWADGIYFNVRTGDRPCVLVLIGADPSGKKERIAIQDGFRESALSWKESLVDLKRRGLTQAPSLATGDGALGFWKALEEEFSETKHQRCWVHKTSNVLDKLPKNVQCNAKRLIHEMYLSPTKQDALKAFDDFIRVYEAKYPRACECLKKDKEVMFTFYAFPAMHWQHIRTTNPIESTFATVRHRTRQTKGCTSRQTALSMVFKLVKQAEKRWQRLRGYKLMHKVVQGVTFINGEEKVTQKNIA